MTACQTFRSEAAKRILIKDGPYGTAIQERKLQSADYCGGLDLMKDQKGNNDLLNLTKPELVRSICEDFAVAGADVLATNTFNANRISQADYGAEDLVGRINRSAAEIVRDVADRHIAKDGRPLWVAGALGPTNKTLSLSPNVNDPAFREVDFDQVKAVYREQIDGLVEGGVDFILIETVFDTLNAKAAIMAALEAEQALGRGFLGVRAACPAGYRRAELLVRGGAASAASRGAVGGRRDAHHGLSECRSAQRAWRI
jgi:5-methyltetrahydrofolate--homocysteine methyltransferase